MEMYFNTNKKYISQRQYEVITKKLAIELHKWLTEFLSFNENLKTFRIDIENDILDLLKVFPLTNKDYLVIDGNSLWATIHQARLIVDNPKNKGKFTENDEITTWANCYDKTPLEGICYDVNMLSKDEYIRDIQLFQIVILLLKGNLHTWEQANIDLFYQKLYKLLFAILYKKHLKEQFLNTSDFFTTYQAINYLLVPNKYRYLRYKSTTKLNFLTFSSLFAPKDNALTNEVYKIKYFKDIIYGMLIENKNHLDFNYTIEKMSLLYEGMVKYQKDSLALYDGLVGFAARDRNIKLVKNCDNHHVDLSYCDILKRDNLTNEEFKNNLDLLIKSFCEATKKEIDNQIKINSQLNKKKNHLPFQKNNATFSDIYAIANFDYDIDYEEFVKMCKTAIKFSERGPKNEK